MSTLGSGLSNTQQALLVFLALALPAVGAWLALGAPTGHDALATLGAALIAAVILFIKEILGSAAPTPAPAAPAPPTT